MDKTIKVTVGIPVYNAGRFLHDAIHSVLVQTFQNFELIITDDGSTDNSLEIAKSFKDNRVKVISDGLNKGIAFRLNEQISMARGDFFIRMDADDLMFPDRIEKQVSFLENHPDIDAIGSQAIVINDENEILGLRDFLIPKSVKEVFRRTIFIHPTVAGKIEWFRKFRYFTPVEDFDLWIRSFKHSKFYKINEPLLFYRDPLKIKLKTYRIRQSYVRKCMWMNRHLLENNILLIFISIKSYLKLLIFQLATIVNYDSKIISRRNLPLNVEKNGYYNTLLKKII